MLNDGKSFQSAFILRINRAIRQLPTFISALSVFCLMGFIPCVQKKKSSPILFMVELQYAENYYFRFCTLSLSAGKRKTLSYYLIMASSSTNEEVVQAGACSLLSGGVNRESVVVVTQKWGGRLGLPGTAACTGKASSREHRSEAKPTAPVQGSASEMEAETPHQYLLPLVPW